MRLIAKAMRISRAKIDCDRLTRYRTRCSRLHESILAQYGLMFVSRFMGKQICHETYLFCGPLMNFSLRRETSNEMAGSGIKSLKSTFNTTDNDCKQQVPSVAVTLFITVDDTVGKTAVMLGL